MSTKNPIEPGELIDHCLDLLKTYVRAESSVSMISAELLAHKEANAAKARADLSMALHALATSLRRGSSSRIKAIRLDLEPDSSDPTGPVGETVFVPEEEITKK